jgi:hypothetical protein
MRTLFTYMLTAGARCHPLLVEFFVEVLKSTPLRLGENAAALVRLAGVNTPADEPGTLAEHLASCVRRVTRQQRMSVDPSDDAVAARTRCAEVRVVMARQYQNGNATRGRRSVADRRARYEEISTSLPVSVQQMCAHDDRVRYAEEAMRRVLRSVSAFGTHEERIAETAALHFVALLLAVAVREERLQDHCAALVERLRDFDSGVVDRMLHDFVAIVLRVRRDEAEPDVAIAVEDTLGQNLALADRVMRILAGPQREDFSTELETLLRADVANAEGNGVDPAHEFGELVVISLATLLAEDATPPSIVCDPPARVQAVDSPRDFEVRAPTPHR